MTFVEQAVNKECASQIFSNHTDGKVPQHFISVRCLFSGIQSLKDLHLGVNGCNLFCQVRKFRESSIENGRIA